MPTTKGFIQMIQFQEALGFDDMQAIEKERSPLYSEKVSDYYRRQNRKIDLQAKNYQKPQRYYQKRK